ncbi:MAG TPA: NAD-dependent epimerase/dehydratase family protein [Longimicrobiaceae bacterium]|nr:NAD-dependent epimerase/dehydratase family protein [Longimicrobiaceae bacterium]
MTPPAEGEPARKRHAGPPRPVRPLRLLLLGGTGFLGRHLAEAALARGHDVTLFNRGRSGPGLFPGATHVRGDREKDLAGLEGGKWDAAIDTSGYLPEVVRRSADLLSGAVDLYVFLSSISAYGDLRRPGVDESAALATLPPGAEHKLTDATFGPLKALCEAQVQEAMPGRTLVVRPGLIVGPYDATDRFGYWVRRVAQGGTVLAPGRPERPVQFVDARDLAEWTLRMVEEGRTGAFNAVGPKRPLAMEWLLETCRVESGSSARFVWASEEFLLGWGIRPWTELPLWVPEAAGEQQGFLAVNSDKAMAAGLTFRPIMDTVRDVRLWEADRARSDVLSPALTADREEELLEAWAVRG